MCFCFPGYVYMMSLDALEGESASDQPNRSTTVSLSMTLRDAPPCAVLSSLHHRRVCLVSINFSGVIMFIRQSTLPASTSASKPARHSSLFYCIEPLMLAGLLGVLLSINSSGVIMFIKQSILPTSPSAFACVPAIGLMAFTLISPLSCWIPILARLTFRAASPYSSSDACPTPIVLKNGAVIGGLCCRANESRVGRCSSA